MEEASTSATSLPTQTKRPRAEEDVSSGNASTVSISLPSSQTDEISVVGQRVPAFLLQSKAEIHQQFEDIEWRSRLRTIEGLNSPTTSKWTLESEFEIQQRNRYANVQPWKGSRIHLKVPPGQCDYINASPISVHDSQTKSETRYIATQGPKESQFNHFWQMVWETTGEVGVIVMLTQISEGGREKCAMYYPADMEHDTITIEDKDPFTDHAPATVKLLEIHHDEAAHSIVRKLELTFEGQSKPIWHLFFTNWPDFGVPEGAEREGLLNLLKLSTSKNPNPLNPRIIHCSAGVGRSGTFIALDHLVRELNNDNLSNTPNGGDPVFEIVNQLREQRMMMVQNENQYQFIYSLLKEQLEARKESKGNLPDLDTNFNLGISDAEERSPKVPKLLTGLDSEVAAAVTSSEEPPAVFAEVDGNVRKEKESCTERLSVEEAVDEKRGSAEAQPAEADVVDKKEVV